MPTWRTLQRIDAAFYSLDINNDDVFRAGSEILYDISQATPESLKQTRIVGAWLNEQDRTLNLACIGDQFAATAIEIATLDDEQLVLQISETQIAENRKRQERTIDYRLSLVLPENKNPNDLYDNAAVRLLDREKVNAGFFPVTVIFKRSGRTERATGNRERALLNKIESLSKNHRKTK